MTTTHTLTYTKTHTSTYVADNMRNVLRNIINYYGLEPDNLLNDWESTSNTIIALLQSGDLKQITIEFYRPGQSTVEARCDFPISYDGSGVEEDMWVDKSHLERTLSKSAKPSPDCLYDVIFINRQGWADIPGFSPCEFRSTKKLVPRSSGTIIATGDIMASTTSWR